MEAGDGNKGRSTQGAVRRKGGRREQSAQYSVRSAQIGTWT